MDRRQSNDHLHLLAVETVSALLEHDPGNAQQRFWRARWLADLWRTSEALADYNQAKEIDPQLTLTLQDAPLLRVLGNRSAGRGDWGEAYNDFAKCSRSPSSAASDWFFFALLQLQRGDKAGYQKTCATMVERFGQSNDGEVQWITATVCGLAPQAVPEPAHFVQLAEKFAKANPKDYAGSRTLGAALLRAAKYKMAVQELNRALKLKHQSPACWLLLAIAHAHNGNADEARKWLVKAQQWIDQAQHPSKTGTSKVKSTWNEVPWHEQLIIQRLRQEAESLVGQTVVLADS
jgi:tetratricopeptide (TPR) repeat protein